MSDLNSFVGRSINGEVFDGTFESAVQVVQMIKNFVGADTHRVGSFIIDHDPHTSYGTSLRFTLKPFVQTVRERSEGQTRTFALQRGDALVMLDGDYELLPKYIFEKFFQPAKEITES